MSKQNGFCALIGCATLVSVGLLPSCAGIDTGKLKAEAAALTRDVPEVWQTTLEAGKRPQNWQTLFADELLANYLAEAQAANLDIEQAAARVRQAEAALLQSASFLGPSIDVDLGISGLSNLSGEGDLSRSSNINTAARWNPDIFGEMKANVRRAEALLQVEAANTERLRRVVLSQTARAYVRIIEADQLLQLAEENLSFIDETRRVSAARFEAGDISRGDLALAELEYENAQASLRNQQFGSRSARRALSILLGGFGDDQLIVSDKLPPAATLGTLPMPAVALQARFDVAASQAALAAQIASLDGVAKGDWPSVVLSGRVGAGGVDIGDLFDPDAYIASLAASLTANLFDSGRNQSQVAGEIARLDAAMSRHKQVLRTAIFEVNDAFDEVATLQTSLASLGRASDAAQEALSVEQIRFDLGETILLDVLTVQRRVNAILATRITTERRLLEAQIAGYLASGASDE